MTTSCPCFAAWALGFGLMMGCGPSEPISLASEATGTGDEATLTSAMPPATSSEGETTSGPSETCVDGVVVIAVGQAVPDTLDGGLVIVALEDQSQADAAAVELGRFELMATDATGLPVPFDVCGLADDPLADYALRAHLDLDLDADISLGDYINIEPVPVINGAPTTGVALPVVLVK